MTVKLSNLKIRIPYTAFFLLYASVAARAFFNYTGNELRYVAYILLISFLALSLTQSLITRRIKLYPDIYLGLQSVLIISLILLPPNFDYFSILFVCLTIQAMMFFSIRKGFIWVSIFSLLLLASLLYALGLKTGSLFYPVPLAGCIMIGLYIMAVRKAEDEKNRSEALFTELQNAYKKLEKYTEQAEELAAAEERTRLARELHDSVSQKLFSMTLTAEAARMIQEKEPSRVLPLLERLQELARDSLSEMRTLIQKLRHVTVTHDGLVLSLKRHFRERQENDGLIVTLIVEGEPQLPSGHEETLFRIVQEALNNIVKHSGVDSATVVLRRDENSLLLSVEDRGRGFNLSEVDTSLSHLGLSNMRDRAKSIGGKFSIETEPGHGSRICVEIPMSGR